MCSRRHLGQGALEKSELLVGQLGHEQVGDPAHVHRSRLGEAAQAGLGEQDYDPACIGGVASSTHQAVLNKAGDPPGHART